MGEKTVSKFGISPGSTWPLALQRVVPAARRRRDKLAMGEGSTATTGATEPSAADGKGACNPCSTLVFLTLLLEFSSLYKIAADFHRHYSNPAGPSGSPVTSFWRESGLSAGQETESPWEQLDLLLLLQPATDEKRNKPEGIRVFLVTVHSLCALHISYRSRASLGTYLFSCQEHP